MSFVLPSEPLDNRFQVVDDELAQLELGFFVKEGVLAGLEHPPDFAYQSDDILRQNMEQDMPHVC